MSLFDRRRSGEMAGAIREAVSRATGTRREQPECVEGAFRSEAFAAEVAEQLRAAFPDSLVTVEDGAAPHRVRVRPRR
ncbi:MAG: hypothetical protein M3Z98_04930 [Candidatus Dormibacteraeota bacterium]|nr:hypothetical protein [Candidatus Dormibacteraeota bacterium]